MAENSSEVAVTTEVAPPNGTTVAAEIGAAPFDPEDYVLFRVAFDMYPIFSFILVAVGTIGNIMSFVVLSRRSMNMTSSSVYLRALAVSDTGCLWMHLLAMLAQTYKSAGAMVSTWFCRWFYFTINSFSATSAWFVMAMTIERFLVIMFPLKAPILVSKKKAIICVVVLSLLAVVLDVYTWWLTTALGALCRYDRQTDAKAEFHEKYSLFEASVAQFIPISLVLIFNCLIIGQMFRMKRIKDRMTNDSNGKKSEKTGGLNQANQIAAMLLSVSITFFFFNAPMMIYSASFTYWIDWEDGEVYALAAFLQIICIMCLFLNYSANFFLYCLTGTKFRAELKLALLCRETPRGGASSTGTSRVMTSVSETVHMRRTTTAEKPEVTANPDDVTFVKDEV